MSSLRTLGAMCGLALLGVALGASPAQAAAVVNGKLKASSSKEIELAPKKKGYIGPEYAVDGLLTKGWAEGEPGYGEGSWLEVDLGQTIEIGEVNLWPGNLSEGKKSFREYSRPRKIKVTISGGAAPIEKEFVLEDHIQRLDYTLDKPVQGRVVRVDILEVYEGFVFSDLYIAEVAVNFRHSRSELEPLIQWLDTPPALKAAEAHEQAIKDAFRKIMESEFGDSDALNFIMDQAGDGATYVRDQVPKVVDVGFRAAAIRPDKTALDALRKLKDANGIPAIEMAQLRSWGKASEELAEIVEIFYAYQDLIGGPDRNVPYWGKSGWELGAIQSFGEPVPVEANANGDIYVADIGNNRVQRFAYDGRADRQWGPEPDITDVWFDRGRTWYVSGARPGTEPGQFTNPLDVELLPVGDGEGFAVLDASKRVQVYDAEGRLTIGWPVKSKSQLDPGVGGEGYLAWVPKRRLLYVFLGDEAIAYTLAAEEVARWKIEDGTPNAVEVTKKGKLYLVFGTDVVLYDLDGFRHGVIWGTDQLGLGFEDLDITLDEDKKIWIVTDQGWAFKWKNQRKLEYKVRFSSISLESPRIAVQEDILYCVDRDRIIRLDAAQARIDAEEAAEEKAASAPAPSLDDE